MDSRFTNQRSEEAFEKMRDWEFTDSKILIQSKLSYPIADLFLHTPLLFILSLAYPFHSATIREFFANLRVESRRTSLTSRVDRRDIEISKEDFAHFLNTSCEGPRAHDISTSLIHNWSPINLVLRNSNYHQHISTVAGLTQNARVIQHVLRHTILPKAGDRTNITPILSVVTYFCMTNTRFDVADLLIRYCENLISYFDPRAKRRHNLALGHIFSHIFYNKYDLAIPAIRDHQPTFFSDSSFHILLGKGKAKGKRPVEEEEEEAADAPPQGEPSAPPPPADDNIAAQLGLVSQRLDAFI